MIIHTVKGSKKTFLIEGADVMLTGGIIYLPPCKIWRNGKEEVFEGRQRPLTGSERCILLAREKATGDLTFAIDIGGGIDFSVVEPIAHLAWADAQGVWHLIRMEEEPTDAATIS